jgi:hypothetical protein
MSEFARVELEFNVGWIATMFHNSLIARPSR